MSVFIIAGTGTGVGKTLVAAIVTEAFKADYWKPVQAGNLEYTDTDFIREFISNERSVLHAEACRLSQPMSPHAAAEIDGVNISLQELSLPKTENKLVVELAGGLMVPINNKELNIDLLKKWNAPVILVSQNYLGSINHTLLSVAALQTSQVKVAGIIFNGEPNAATENFILQYCKIKYLGRITPEAEITKLTVQKYAQKLAVNLNTL